MRTFKSSSSSSSSSLLLCMDQSWLLFICFVFVWLKVMEAVPGVPSRPALCCSCRLQWFSRKEAETIPSALATSAVCSLGGRNKRSRAGEGGMSPLSQLLLSWTGPTVARSLVHSHQQKLSLHWGSLILSSPLFLRASDCSHSPPKLARYVSVVCS